MARSCVFQMFRCAKNKVWNVVRCCSRYSLQAAIWAVVLMMLVATITINSSLQNKEQEILKEIEQTKMKMSEQVVKQEPQKQFNPFDVPKSLEKIKIEDLPVQPPKKKIVVNKEADIKAKPKEVPFQTKTYLINWYNPPPYLKNKPAALHCGFEKCKYKNCKLSLDRNDREKSDAILFDGRWVFEKVGFKRPQDQIWIFAAHEAPVVYEELGSWWKQPQWRYGFNWTMTYDKDNTDIFLPYGELRKHTKVVNRDFKAIAKQKTQGALMINSHCPTLSYREVFVQKLSQFIPVDVLGKCGKPWNCGTHYVHDECFNLLNTTYKFFLAFENALCHQYFSEKIFENFNYDIINIVRGGSIKEAQAQFPKGTVISTDDFHSIEGLGKFLGKLSWSLNDYAEMLKTKSQYYSPGYTAVYQRAMCDLCERMNYQHRYAKRIKDIVDWAYGKDPCRNATDLN